MIAIKEQIQIGINSALLRACDIFKGAVSADIYKDIVLSMFFLKYISDNIKKPYESTIPYNKDSTSIIKNNFNEIIIGDNFNLNTIIREFKEDKKINGISEKIDELINEIDGNSFFSNKNGRLFQNISFNIYKLGEIDHKNELIGELLEVFSSEDLNLRIERIGSIDIIGSSFDFLIKHFASNGHNIDGFYTPLEVSELLAKLVSPKSGDAIFDPACGSGSLLLKCANEISKNESANKDYSLFGQEIIASTCSLAKMNMLLHGEQNFRIEWGDTLKNPLLIDNANNLMKFNVVVSCPPFNLSNWGYEDADNDIYNRFTRGIPPRTRGDYAFISHMIETLAPRKGTMGVIVPHGVLFRGGSEGLIRKNLIDENLLDAVIGLPEKLFYGTNIPSAILIFKNDKKNKEYIFIDASKEFKPGKNNNILEYDNINKIVEIYRSRSTINGLSFIASFDDIVKNDYNLNIARYIRSGSDCEQSINLDDTRDEILQLRKKLKELEIEMDEYIK